MDFNFTVIIILFSCVKSGVTLEKINVKSRWHTGIWKRDKAMGHS